MIACFLIAKQDESPDASCPIRSFPESPSPQFDKPESCGSCAAFPQFDLAPLGVFIRWCFKSPVMGGLETAESWDAPSWSPAALVNIPATPRNRVFFYRSPRRLHKITLQKTMRMTGSSSKNDQTCWSQISGLQDVANPHGFPTPETVFFSGPDVLFQGSLGKSPHPVVDILPLHPRHGW